MMPSTVARTVRAVSAIWPYEDSRAAADLDIRQLQRLRCRQKSTQAARDGQIGELTGVERFGDRGGLAIENMALCRYRDLLALRGLTLARTRPD
jgi:hypothetical protein